MGPVGSAGALACWAYSRLMSIAPFEQAVASTRAVLSAVTPDQLDLGTPCASWKVSDLIDHIVGAQYFFLDAMNGTPPSGEGAKASSGDYVAAFDAATAKVHAALDAEGALDKMYTLPFGTMPGTAVLGLAVTDTFTHGWDLAKATGQSTDLDPTLATNALEQAKMMIMPAIRGPEPAPFGPEQTAPEGATAADKLAAFLGRTV
jgi:uncharacterized protein (TIGR03086 family)